MKTPDGTEIDKEAVAGASGADGEPLDLEMDKAWARPVAMAKDRNVRVWLVFLGLVCLGVALWTPLRALYYRYGYKKVEVAVIRDADTFVAIAYYGINSEAQPGSRDITRAAFEQHLRLLRERGYIPISLADVRAFYKEGKLLPRKAVLMTFEQSRKSSYFEIRKLLHNYKWKAVMGVVTTPMHKRDAQTLLWPYLRDMVTMSYWDLAAQSERGFEFIETSPSGRKGHYLSNPLWKSDESRYELPSEFNKRVAEDHTKVIAEFQKEVGFKPVAFFFPFGDYGQYEEQAKVVRVSNLHQVGANYDLGFTLGQLALNSRASDPRRLNRLLVNPEWTPLEFINKLDSFWPLDPVQEGYDRGYEAERWIGEWGDVFIRDNELVLRAIPPVNPVMTSQQAPSTSTAGAKAWLAGSDTFKDGFISIRFQLKRGLFGVYLRSTPVGSYVYFSLDDAGQVSVRQRLPDMDELILATDGLIGDLSSSHELLLSIRDNLLFTRLDNKTLFGGRILLRGEDRPGMIAAGVWDTVPGIAEAIVMDTRVFGRRDALVTWTPDVAKDIGYLTMWLNEHGYQFNVLSPPWLDIFQNTPITFPIWDREALSLLAKANEMRVMPQVLIRDASLLLQISAEDLVEKALEHKGQGLYVDTSDCTPEQVTPLVTWLIKLNEALSAKNLSLILTLPVSIETLPSAGNILNLLPGVVLAGRFQRPPFGLKDSEVMGITHVVPSASDETLSLYYQLSDMLAVYDDVSPDAKKEELRQNGYDAFTTGDYEAAIRLWQKWADEDPRNAEALALIGDAWLRLNDRQKALEYYKYSLDINPGQMNLAIRQSRLLENMNLLDDSAKTLNVYARAFPDSPALTIAQAQWLDRNRQRREARNVMKSLVERHPENIEARLILQTLLDESAARYANMQELLAIGRGAETQLFGFGRDIFAAELLTIPEASVFFDFVRETAMGAASKKTSDLYKGFLPLTEKVTENFISDKLSDNWIAFGGFRPAAYGKYELRAGSDMSEAFLRLKHSELLRDGFLEATLDESAGSFWLYARRSSKSMVRFGYDDEGFIRIQTWFNGELRTYDSRPWLRPPGIVRLRLDVRGDGAVGYVNDRQVFTTPLSIPSDVCYGWWSIAPFAPELGLARVRIARIECGPLAPTVILLPRLEDSELSGALDLLRRHVREISALSPVTFTQLPDGTVPTEPEIALAAVRMFCTFHRLRMIPIVDLAYFSDMLPEHLTNLILKYRLNGLILRVRTMPDSEWFGKMEKALEQTAADMIVVQQEDSYWPVVEAKDDLDTAQYIQRLKLMAKANVREIQRGSLLLHPSKESWQVHALSYPAWSDKIDNSDREGIEPRLVILPRRYKELMGADGAVKRKFVEIALPQAAEQDKAIGLTAKKTADKEAEDPAVKDDEKDTAKDVVKENLKEVPVPDDALAEPLPDAAKSLTNAPPTEAESPQSLWQKLRSRIGSDSSKTNSLPVAGQK